MKALLAVFLVVFAIGCVQKELAPVQTTPPAQPPPVEEDKTVQEIGTVLEDITEAENELSTTELDSLESDLDAIGW